MKPTDLSGSTCKGPVLFVTVYSGGISSTLFFVKGQIGNTLSSQTCMLFIVATQLSHGSVKTATDNA